MSNGYHLEILNYIKAYYLICISGTYRYVSPILFLFYLLLYFYVYARLFIFTFEKLIHSTEQQS